VPLVFDSCDSGAYGAERKSSACVVQTGAAPNPQGRIVNKAQLIDAVASKLDISRRSAGDTVDAVLDGITGAIISGDKVSLTGFGTFETTRRAARTARNPRTGESVDVPAATVPKFRPGQALKDEVNTSTGRKRAAAKKVAAKKAAAKKTAVKAAAKPAAKKTATKVVASRAAVKPAARKTTVKAAPVKAAAKKTTVKAAAKPAAKKTTAKAVAKKTVAKKVTGTARPAAKKVVAKAPATKAVAKKTTAKKAPARKR
jgi:DNA-binding protein HU-beta